jgi:hypothetical protein
LARIVLAGAEGVAGGVEEPLLELLELELLET